MPQTTTIEILTVTRPLKVSLKCIFFFVVNRIYPYIIYIPISMSQEFKINFMLNIRLYFHTLKIKSWILKEIKHLGRLHKNNNEKIDP